MHSRLLDYFEAIARHGSIRKAGEVINVAPSAINRHLLELEAIIGAPLFKRLPRGMRLTSAGEILLMHVRTTLRDYDRALTEIEQLKTGIRGQLCIACIESALADVLPAIVHPFAERFPRIEIKVVGVPANQAIRLVQDGTADVCVVFNPPPKHPLVEVADAKFQLGVVAAPGHPLSRSRSLGLSDLVGEQLVMPDESVTIYDQVNQVLSGTGLRLKPRLVSNSITFMQAYVELGNAVTILTPVGISRKLRNKELVFIPLKDRGLAPQRLIAGVHGSSLSTVVDNFCQHLRSELPTVFAPT